MARIGVLIALPALLAGCLSFEEPEPSPAPPTPRPSVVATVPPRDPGTLMVAVPADPARLLPPADDPAAAIVVEALYDPLYRLDPTLTPQPELAGGMPLVSGGGRSWSIALARDDLVFQDGSPLGASDVAFSLRVARSPACPLGRDLCAAVARHLESIDDAGDGRVAFTLREPWQPFLAEVLGRLPIVSEAAVRAGAAAIRDGARTLDPAAPDGQVARVAEATNADACFSDAPPFGCRLADHIQDLEGLLGSVGLALPSRATWTDATGAFDAESYAGALLDRVAALGQVLGGREIDQLAAALTLIDPAERPLGSGPYRLERAEPGVGLSLVANAAHVGGPPAIERIELLVVPDPAVAATMLQSGDVDWLPQVGPDQLPALERSSGVIAGIRPLPVQRTIVFNAREGRLYEDPRTRQAFARCLDRDALVEAATGGAGIPADTWAAPGSWAFPSVPGPARDPAGAAELLDAAGWRMGQDGIRTDGERRLSTEIAVRPSRADLAALTAAAADQLRECGIELLVRDLDLTGDLLLRQLQWPNDFETALISRTLGVDPDHDMEAYASAHVTTEENPADANPGGYASDAVDLLIEEARVASGQDARAERYARLGDALDADQPAWPIWYDTAAAAISARVRSGADPIDPSRPRYDWDLARWSLRPLS